ncbi:unnamed protein product, partial [Prorocentrum cordatum]
SGPLGLARGPSACGAPSQGCRALPASMPAGAGARQAALAALAALARASPGGFVYDPEQRIESARLFGNLNKYAYYFTDVMVGLPVSQRTSVIIDTGSRLVGFPCSQCTHCGDHLDPAFDLTSSGTARWFNCSTSCPGSCLDGRCPYRESYAEGSTVAGYWFEDFLELGDPDNRNPPVRENQWNPEVQIGNFRRLPI